MRGLVKLVDPRMRLLGHKGSDPFEVDLEDRKVKRAIRGNVLQRVHDQPKKKKPVPSSFKEEKPEDKPSKQASTSKADKN